MLFHRPKTGTDWLAVCWNRIQHPHRSLNEQHFTEDGRKNVLTENNQSQGPEPGEGDKT